MNDLRATLAEHAEITDTAAGTRSAEIARRVRVVRRRRAGTAGAIGVAAAAAVVATAVGVGLPSGGDHEPSAASRLLGVRVPRSVTADGYSYDYVRSVRADTEGASNSASVKVPAGNRPVLISWVTEGGDQRVVVHPQGERFISEEPDFADHTVVYPADHTTTVRVTGHSAVALAVYHLDPTAPDGVTRDGITFRREVPGRQLLGAVVAPEGADHATFDVTVQPGQRLDFSRLCRATGSFADHEAWLSVAIDGRSAFGTGCNGAEPTFDPGSDYSWGPIRHRTAGHLTVSLRLLDRPHGRPLHDPHARIGMGAYAVTDADRDLGHGLTAPATIEYDGHTWQLRSTRTGIAAVDRPYTARVPGGDERQLTYFTQTGVSRASTAALVVDRRAGDFIQAGGSEWGRYLAPGTTSTVGAKVLGRHDARVAIGIYRMVD